jgi:Ni/Co efflux regulator RcnB
MKTTITGVIVLALLSSSAAIAQPDHHGNRHGHKAGRDNYGRHVGWGRERGMQHRWNRGERMGYNDWRGAQTVDYRQYRLRQPPRGYEWRRQNDQFILGAVATGLIVSIIASSGR